MHLLNLVILFILVEGTHLGAKEKYTIKVFTIFYVLKSVINLIVLIIFLILAKRYKFRVRENEINIYLIAKEQYERYLDQEDRYRREMGLSLESTD